MNDRDELLRELRQRGWRVEMTRRSGHWKLTHPKGGVVFAPGTPSDHRSLLNVRSKIRRLERSHDTP